MLVFRPCDADFPRDQKLPRRKRHKDRRLCRWPCALRPRLPCVRALGVLAMRPLSSPRNGIRRLGTVRRWSQTPAPRNRPVLQMTHDARASSLLICWCPYRRPGVPGAVVLQAARGDAVEIAHVSTRVHPTSVFSARACCVSYRLTSPNMLTEVMHRFTVSPSDFTRCSGFSPTAQHGVRGAAGLKRRPCQHSSTPPSTAFPLFARQRDVVHSDFMRTAANGGGDSSTLYVGRTGTRSKINATMVRSDGSKSAAGRACM